MEQPSEQIEAFQQALEALESTGIPYAITGSWVVSAYGILRATHDLDVVVAVQGGEAAQLIAAFPSPRYYADEAAIAEALASRSFFNIIDGDSTWIWPTCAIGPRAYLSRTCSPKSQPPDDQSLPTDHGLLITAHCLL